MSKQFIVDRHTTPGTPALDPVAIPKVPVYDTMADAEADLSNLAVGQIVATPDTGDEMADPVDVIEDGNMHAATSNAVAKSLSYSTTEQLTGGKWIDGKPIYRRVFTGTASNTNQAENIATISNVSSVVSVRNLQKANNAGWYENWGYAKTTSEELESSAYFDITTGKLYQSHKSSIFNSQPYTVILEYTKTTD